MPACGKSTAGVILAKILGVGFVDTDLMIQTRQKNTLQKLIDLYGIDKFREFEENALLSVKEKSDTVIATGGSAVFCEKGMDFLKENGVCVYIETPESELKKRLSDIKTRGIVRRAGETVNDIMKERTPLYERYADIKICCGDDNAKALAEKIAKRIAAEL